jgi:hypothetical protein
VGPRAVLDAVVKRKIPSLCRESNLRTPIVQPVAQGERLGIFLFPIVTRPALGHTQLPIQWAPGALYLEIKRPGREADHSSPSSAKVKNAWSYTSIPKYVFTAKCLVKHRINFTFIIPSSSPSRSFKWAFYEMFPHRNSAGIAFIYHMPSPS